MEIQIELLKMHINNRNEKSFKHINEYKDCILVKMIALKRKTVIQIIVVMSLIQYRI